MNEKSLKILGSAIGSAIIAGMLGFQGAHWQQGPVQPESVVKIMVETIESLSDELAACRHEDG